MVKKSERVVAGTVAGDLTVLHVSESGRQAYCKCKCGSGASPQPPIIRSVRTLEATLRSPERSTSCCRTCGTKRRIGLRAQMSISVIEGRQ